LALSKLAASAYNALCAVAADFPQDLWRCCAVSV